MNATKRFASVVAIAGLVAAGVAVPVSAADDAPPPFKYESGKLTPQQYTSVGKKVIPFKKNGEFFLKKELKTMAIFQFWVDYNKSNVYDDPEINNDGWYTDMTMEMYKKVEAMFKEMGFTVKDREAFVTDSSYLPVKELAAAQSKCIFSTEEYRRRGGIFKDGKFADATAEMSYRKESAPGLYFYDLQAVIDPKAGVFNIAGNIKQAVGAFKDGNIMADAQLNSLSDQVAHKQNLEMVPRVHITWGLNDEKKGTPQIGMEINFAERSIPPDTTKKVRVEFHSAGNAPLTLGSGPWWYKKADNRIPGSKKQLSGEKVKATSLEMFDAQCKVYAATFNMHKAKFGAKKK